MQNNIFFGHSEPSTLIVLDKTPSTNDYLKQLLANFKPQLPFTAIMANHQTQGRGQRGATWTANAKENLTASFLCSPKNRPLAQQFITTITSSLAVYEVLEEFITGTLTIKWPNDIMVNNKKIAGILIENKISSSVVKHSIIGIGINVYSTTFPPELVTKATAIRLENFEFNLTIVELVKRIQQRLIQYEAAVVNGQADKLWELYCSRLFRKDIHAQYKIGEIEKTGIIRGVDKDGKLRLNIDSDLHRYDLKDVTYLL